MASELEQATELVEAIERFADAHRMTVREVLDLLVETYPTSFPIVTEKGR